MSSSPQPPSWAIAVLLLLMICPRPRDVQLLATIFGLKTETPRLSHSELRSLWHQASPEERARLGQVGWDNMVGFWATHPAYVKRHDRTCPNARVQSCDQLQQQLQDF